MTDNMKEFRRIRQLAFSRNPMKGSAATFLWGPRQVGKTTLLRQRFPDAARYDLLISEVCSELTLWPGRWREEVLARPEKVVVIDEVQKSPGLLDEVHWLLEHTDKAFVLCGSSARKLRRESRNLLGGRAVEAFLLPLTSTELPDLDLDRYLNHGGLPAHYLLDDPSALLRSYVSTYVKQEVMDESLTRNIPAFARFLQIVGLTHGRQLNYANVAREADVSASTVRSYYQILQETLLGYELPPWRRKGKRRLVETAKFYLFDVGVANQLLPEPGRLTPGTDLHGRAFEHFVLGEVRAYLAYHDRDLPLTYWRTSSGFEVDLLVGDLQLAIECKSARDPSAADLKGLRALREERPVGRALVVCRCDRPRLTEDGIAILPWQQFCRELWAGELLGG
jgi:predicted AAA+ superfamily ATPase